MNPTVNGVPIGCRSPRKRGPYSTPKHSQFAEIAGVTPRTVSNWVSGRTRINPSALAMLDLLERHGEVRRALCVGVKAIGAPRRRAFKAGNPYRFGDRRSVAIAGAQMARIAA